MLLWTDSAHPNLINVRFWSQRLVRAVIASTAFVDMCATCAIIPWWTLLTHLLSGWRLVRLGTTHSWYCIATQTIVAYWTLALSVCSWVVNLHIRTWSIRTLNTNVAWSANISNSDLTDKITIVSCIALSALANIVVACTCAISSCWARCRINVTSRAIVAFKANQRYRHTVIRAIVTCRAIKTWWSCLLIIVSTRSTRCFDCFTCDTEMPNRTRISPICSDIGWCRWCCSF